eukprot:6481173-Amphidinium_carterae.1
MSRTRRKIHPSSIALVLTNSTASVNSYTAKAESQELTPKSAPKKEDLMAKRSLTKCSCDGCQITVSGRLSLGKQVSETAVKRVTFQSTPCLGQTQKLSGPMQDDGTRQTSLQVGEQQNFKTRISSY